MGSADPPTTPLFSVVIPVHGVEDYVGACLESVSGQTFDDYEALVIDDGSPDSCGQIIDKYAEQEARIVPIHLSRAHGLGPARNVGIERAGGRYLVFLDGDDEFAPDALRRLAQHLIEHDEPEVALYDYVMTPPCEITCFSNLHRWVPPAIDGPFRVRDVPLALRVAWTAWNKAYRRDFIERFALRFASGTFEDAPWACSSLVAASSVTALHEVCVRYRCCRRGSITRSRSSRHADIFTQFDRLYDFLADHPYFEFHELRPEITRRMTLIMQSLGAEGGLIPPEILADFRTRCEQYFEDRRPAHYDGPDLRWPPTPWDAWADTGGYAPLVWGEDPVTPARTVAPWRNTRRTKKTPEVQPGGLPFTR